MRKTMLAGAGGVLAALLGSLCCTGPLLFVSLGVSAGLASTFEPLRPVFGVAMLGLFALGFYAVYGRGVGTGSGRRNGTTSDRSRAGESCDTDGDCAGVACAAPRDQRREKIILWTAALVALLLWTFPAWSRLLAPDPTV